jgi:hypothetical protein
LAVKIKAKSETGLFWNEQGAVNCEKHIPYPGSDTWNWERWQAVTVSDKLEAARADISLRCECCKR